MINYSDALRIVAECSTREMPAETVPLVLASGRVLANSITSSENIPSHDNSAMDGYAVRSVDLAAASTDAPVRLTVVDESSAGRTASVTLHAGQAVRIMTGGLLPDGADAVVEVESTNESDGIVSVMRHVRVGDSVRVVGDDVRAGEVVLPAGRRLTAGDIGILAALGIVNVPVRTPVKVGILSTGNELVEAFKTPARGQLRNSSLPALYAMCSDAGAEPIDLGIAHDDRDSLTEIIEHALRFDVLLTTGGVSAGAYDLVRHILPAVGVDIKFHHINIRPGKPVLFGVYSAGPDQTLVFGLPGNPVSTLVTFRQLVLPAIRGLMRQRFEQLILKAELVTPLKKNDSKRHFVRGIVRRDDDGVLRVSSTGTQSSGAMSSMSRANCIIVLSETDLSREAGDTVDIELL